MTRNDDPATTEGRIRSLETRPLPEGQLATGIDSVTLTIRDFPHTPPGAVGPSQCSVVVRYSPRLATVDAGSLEAYLGTQAKVEATVEELASRLADDVAAALKPRELSLELTQRSADGLTITAKAIRGE